MAMENQVNLQRTIIFHLEDLMIMYSIYDSDTLEKFIDTVHKMHNKTTWNEKLFAGQLKDWFDTKEGIQLCHKFSFVHNYDEGKNMLKCMKSLSVSCRCMPM